MGTDFLAVARDWRDAADALRVTGVPDGDPALGVWREAVWVYVLLDRGLFPFALARLAVAARELTGVPQGAPARPASRAEAVLAATELLARMRAAVSARYPGVFGRRHVCCDRLTDE